MKTKTEIINETVLYYSEDVNRRSISEQGGCSYLNHEGKMCAVGRCFTEEGLEKYGNASNFFGLNMIDSFKEEYKVYDTGFWEDLQKLHDYSGNWTSVGLSNKGRESVNYLLGIYKGKENANR